MFTKHLALGWYKALTPWGFFFCILQHLATKLCTFTKLKELALAAVLDSILPVLIKT